MNMHTGSYSRARYRPGSRAVLRILHICYPDANIHSLRRFLIYVVPVQPHPPSTLTLQDQLLPAVNSYASNRYTL